MPIIDETKLNQQLKQSLHSAYLLYGTQNYLIDLYADLILKEFCEQFNEEVQVQVMDYETLDYTQLEDHLLSVGFFSAQKAVLIRNFETAKITNDDKKRLLSIIEQLDQDSLLIIKAVPVEKPKAGKTATFAKNFVGSAVLLEKRSKEQVNKFVLSFAKQQGANLGLKEANYLIENTSEDMLFLQNEVLKLAAYKGNKPITIDDIEKLSPKTVEQRAFDLIDHLLKNNMDKCLTQLDYLYHLGEETISIFSAFAATLTDIYRLKVAKETSDPQNYLSENFGYKPTDFRVKKAGWYVNKLSWQQLDKIAQALFDCDKKLKFTAIDNRLVLETCMIQIYNIYKG